jgi:two-component system sensor histidine kinase KdpD
VGLGLALSRGFVEAVGGELDIEDTPGGGCTVVIRIPEDASGSDMAPPEDPIADTSGEDRGTDQPDARDGIGGQVGDATAPTPAPVAHP